MEYGMDSGHRRRKSEAIGDGGDNGRDSEGAEVARFELRTWIFGESDMVGRKTNTVANAKRKGAAVAISLLSLLGFGKLKGRGDGGLDITEVSEIVGSIGVTPGINKKGRCSRMETVVGEKRSLVSGGMDRVIVGELSNRKPRGPVGVLGGDICAKDLFNSTVGNFRLAIGLRVVGSGEIQFGAKGGEDSFPEFGGDTGVTV